MRDAWNTIKDFYTENFKISEEVVDIVADHDILLLCASGLSNISIASFLNVDVEDVASAVEKFYGFRGWISDMKINPYKEYRTDNNKDTFIERLESAGIDKDAIFTSYALCEKCFAYDNRIEKEWV
jgi:hypothetical protein